MKLKSIVTFLYLIISIPLFIFFYVQPIIWVSFFINFLVLTYIANYHLNIEKVFSPFLTSFIIFSYLFLLMAPMIQIMSIESNKMLFPNAFPFRATSVVFTNFLILLFNSGFFYAYIFFKKKKNQKLEKDVKDASYFTPLLILILFIICLMIFLSNYDYILHELTKSVYAKSEGSISSLLIKKKMLFMIPLGAIVVTYKYLKTNKKITTNTLISFLILTLLIVLLFVFKNPLIEKRNALGPIYITLIYLFYPKLINSNAKFFLFLFLSMMIVFPLISAITHLDASLAKTIANPEIFFKTLIESGSIISTFNSLHYDSFSNIMATIEYVTHYGYSLGYQLLGALLFFVPRSIWHSKPLSTGQEVGVYLVDYHDFGDGKFTNLSNPIISEAYVNFGIFGVLLMFIVLAYVIVRFLNWFRSGDSLKEIIAFYFAVHLMFLLRGDLANGIAYFIGPLIGVYLTPKIINKFLKK